LDPDCKVGKQGSSVTRFAIVLGVFGIALGAASPATAERSQFFGIVQRELDAQDLRGMAAARVRTERFQLGWNRVEPTQGTFQWGPTDRIVGGLASHGIQPVPFVWGSPPWVRPGPSRPPVDSPFAESAWRNFLKAAVARYGPGGRYWANGYRQRYGAGATPRPIRSWQIWNEPNLQKYFDPGGTSGQGINKYARLVKISHDAIKSRDPHAKIVLAGLLGRGNPFARVFLSGLYEVPGFKDDFDVAALHPYTGYPDEFRQQILQFRGVMNQHGDRRTPLWITEFGWGSSPRDRFGINKGLAGQAQMLSIAFGVILRNRNAWNIQRLFWFLWRDPPAAGGRGCSFCGSAGLLRQNRTPKPAYSAFRSFASETTPPRATITAGPSQGSFTRDPTPSFSVRSDEPGSTFACKLDGSAWNPCDSPRTAPALADGNHVFYVKAIDAPGNESRVLWRSFTVDTVAPAVTISSGPAQGAISSILSPFFRFASNDSDANISCQLDGGGFGPCSSPFSAPSLADGPHTFQVRAIDRAHNTDVAARTWTVDTTAPVVTFSSGPAGGLTSRDRSPSFAFDSNDPSAVFRCRLDGGGFDACRSPFSASGLADGSHTLEVRARDTVQNVAVASRTWTVAGPADVSIIAGPASGSFTSDPTPSFVFASLDSDSSFRCRIDGAPFSSCNSPKTTTRLSDRRHTFVVRATDAARTTDISQRTFTVDTSVPVLRIKGHRKVWTRTRQASAAFTLKASEPVDRRCRVDSRRFEPCSRRYRTPRLLRGTHILKIQATDRVGNVGTKRERFKILRR
jgi:hypothetical protein